MFTFLSVTVSWTLECFRSFSRQRFFFWSYLRLTVQKPYDCVQERIADLLILQLDRSRSTTNPAQDGDFFNTYLATTERMTLRRPPWLTWGWIQAVGWSDGPWLRTGRILPWRCCDPSTFLFSSTWPCGSETTPVEMKVRVQSPSLSLKHCFRCLKEDEEQVWNFNMWCACAYVWVSGI